MARRFCAGDVFLTAGGPQPKRLISSLQHEKGGARDEADQFKGISSGRSIPEPSSRSGRTGCPFPLRLPFQFSIWHHRILPPEERTAEFGDNHD